MQILVSPEVEELITRMIASGRYTCAGEVVREALRMLEEHEQSQAARLEEFNRELKVRLCNSRTSARTLSEEIRRATKADRTGG
jgi:putative addiction module CopG family antidote